MKDKILFTFLLLLTTSMCYAQTNTFGPPGVGVTEEDGNPDTRCQILKFSNGTVTDNADGSCSIASGGGGGGISAGALDIDEAGSNVISAAGTMDFDGNDFNVVQGATAGTGFITISSTIKNANGDVTSVGDCPSGACADGTSDGGTEIELYDASGNTYITASGTTYFQGGPFRAGGTGNTATGLNAFVAGNNNTADGSHNIALGLANSVNGNRSSAIGWMNISNGGDSFAAGIQNKASGAGSIALGNGATASNSNAVALGNAPTASGNSSFAVGSAAVASGDDSFSFGANTDATADFSFSIGRSQQNSTANSAKIGFHTSDSSAYGLFIESNKVTVGEPLTVSTTFTVSGLVNCDTIDTDANGVFSCGTDETGGGGGASDLTIKDKGSTIESTVATLNSISSLIDFAAVAPNGVTVTFDLATLAGSVVTLTGDWVNTANPWAVNEGGTGASSLTDGGILLGSGTGAITALGVASNGQIPIGDGTTDPQLSTITGTANEVEVTNGAGSITLGLPDDVTIGDILTVTTSLVITGAAASDKVLIISSNGTVQASGSTITDHTNIIYVAKHGNDSNDGLTPNDAKLTVAAGNTATSSGDTLLVLPGTYTETGIQLKDGVNLVCMDRDNTIITGAPSAGTGTDDTNGVIEPQGDHYVGNCSVIDTNDPDVTVFTSAFKVAVANSTITFENVFIHGGYDGLIVEQETNNVDLVFKNSEVEGDYDPFGIWGDNGTTVTLYNTIMRSLAARTSETGRERCIGVETNGSAPMTEIKTYNSTCNVLAENADTLVGGIWVGGLTSGTGNAIVELYETTINITGNGVDDATGLMIQTGSSSSSISMYGGSINVNGAANNYKATENAGTIALYQVSSTNPANGTLTYGDIEVPTEEYDATNWNGDFTVPTKDAVRDKIETLGSGATTDAGAVTHVTSTTDDWAVGATSSSGADWFVDVGTGEATLEGTLNLTGGTISTSQTSLTVETTSGFDGIDLDGTTTDPCPSVTAGFFFYNKTSNYPCFCDGTNDVKMNDNTTACF